jgi:branched-chain amino acid transport system permease protein
MLRQIRNDRGAFVGGKFGRAVAFGVLAGAALVLGAGAAGAQEPAPPSTAPSAPSSTSTTAPPSASGPLIAGRFVSGSEPIEGVTVTATAVDVAAGPDFDGEATSDEDGNWSIEVPGPGTYRVAIDVDTIPEGFALENPDRFELPRFPVFPGATVRNAVFAFESDEGGGLQPPTTFERFVRLFVSGIRFGLIIGLCSVGLSLIYGTTGLVNFAHGELVTLGALLAWFFNSSSGGPELTLVFAAVIAIALSGAFGGGLEIVIWRPMVRRHSGNLARMLVSIGLALFLRYGYQVVFGSSNRSYRQYTTQEPLDLGPLNLTIKTYIVMLICLVALLAVGFALQRTRLGTAIRAVADERDLAASSGIDVRRVILVVWISGAALAALGGILLGVSQGVQWNMGFRLLLTMFAAVVLGGLGSAFGAMVGGLIVGIASDVSTYWIDPDLKFAVALVILILVLMVRPQGIFGVRERVG